MDNKELLLLDSDNNNSIDTKANEWCIVDNATVENFIKNIVTSIGSANEQQEKFRAIISGVPSPWARVLLTRKAVSQPKSELHNTVLDECYKLLKSEWRGLVAAYALHPDSFEFSEPICLTGKNVSENNGDMSVRYIYGQMLFDETSLWVHKNDKVESIKNPPCIQILYYKKNDGNGVTRIPVAATSPYTFLFSSVNYDMKRAVMDIQKSIPWIGNDGKFFDPLQLTEFNINDMQRLYSFLNMISSNIESSDNEPNDPDKFYIDRLRSVCTNEGNGKFMISDFDRDVKTHISNWLNELGRWQKELENKIELKGEAPNPNIPLTYNNKPEGPLALLLNSEQKFYFYDGAFSIKEKLGSELLSSNIFIDSDFIAAWDNNPENGKDYSKSAAYYVIDIDNKKYAYPLPFTNDALRVFETNIESIVAGTGSDSYVRLCAKSDGVRVEFELNAKLDKAGKDVTICKKTYQMSVIPETDGKVFVWPNFCSPNWKKYFYYSEFPSNVSGVRMLPYFDDGFNAESEVKNAQENIFLVRYPIDKVAANSHKYEIIQTKSPLKLIDIKLNKYGAEVNGGVLLLKRTMDETRDSKTNVLRKVEISLDALQKATVGIDYGSTNTCAYYKLENGQESKPIPFSNRRLALVGFDSPHGALAGKDELLFISNEGTAFPNGQVKSWLHLHNTQYLATDDISQVIVGGVPVNESNISVKSMNEQIIQTNAGELHYNMKWYSDTEKRKKAFIKMLWLQICADMIDCDGTKCYPENLNWSFPSSMTNTDRDLLKNVYTDVEYPINGIFKPNLKDYTEAEAVCAYSKHKKDGLDDETLNLGIDVGGSTSDILIVGENMSSKVALLTQSSIRMAGGFFFNAINSSPRFRKALYDFHESHQTNVNIKNIQDVVDTNPEIYGRAPYYLNNLFDQLSTEKDFYYFYNFIRMNVSPVFAYPAYVTGCLMFYSGMLIKNVVKKNGLDSLKNVNMRYYGKGGRLFEWLLDVYSDDGEIYYRKCFYAGYGSKDVRLSIIRQQKEENKSEVAIGLVSGLFNQIEQDRDEYGKRIPGKHYDIIGEKGIRCTKTDTVMEDLDLISEELFSGGFNMKMPNTLENFSVFIEIFTEFLKEKSIVRDIAVLERGKDDLRVKEFIQNDTEFNKCLDEKGAIYRMPIFIAAALSYLNDVLLPEVSNQLR